MMEEMLATINEVSSVIQNQNFNEHTQNVKSEKGPNFLTIVERQEAY